MTQSSITQLACRGCGAEISRKKVSGAPPTRCSACLRQDRLISQRGVKQRRRDGIKGASSFICKGCQQAFEREHPTGAAPQWCKPCRAKREQERGRLRTAVKKINGIEAFKAQGRWSRCVDCDAKIRAFHRQGRLATRCERCNGIYLRAYHRARHARTKPLRRTTYVCRGCSETKRFKPRCTWRLWCPPCSYQRFLSEAKRRFAENPEPYLKVRRRNRYRRRLRMKSVAYERFDPMDIFERDGWKCGICSKRINKRLKYPHPMSASLDHKVPIANGGDHLPENTQASHLRCNLRKREHAAPIGMQIPLFV